MLTSGEAITAVLRMYVNPGSDVYQYDEELRWRVRLAEIQVCQDIAHYAPFWWKRANGSIVLTAGVGTLPSDFNSFGTHGGIYVSSNSEPLTYLPSDDLMALLTTSPQNGIPTAYTLFDRDGLGNAKVYCWPTNNSTLLLKQYDKRVPDLIDCAIPPGVAVLDTVGLLNGAYTYVVTFVTATGETEAGFISDTVEPALQQVSLSQIPVSPARSVTSRKIYRTAAGGLQHKLLTTIADNLTTTFTDNVADGSLGVNVPTPATALYTGLESIPADFHESLILDGLRQRMAASINDPREVLYSQTWIRSVRNMWADQKPGQQQGWAMPAYGSSQGGASAADYWRRRIPT